MGMSGGTPFFYAHTKSNSTKMSPSTLWGIIAYILLLAECQSFYMVVDVDVSHVGSLVPSWFAGHIIRNASSGGRTMSPLKSCTLGPPLL